MGLLLARPVLRLHDLDQEYEGNVEATGEDFSIELSSHLREGGLSVLYWMLALLGPLLETVCLVLLRVHWMVVLTFLSDKRFVGYKKDDKQLDAEIHRKYIYGGHVADYMRTLVEEEPEKYQAHFSEYINKGIEADDMEALYKKVHAAIRADPTMVKSTQEPPKEH